MNETVWELHPGQIQVHNSNARFKVLSCGRRWGKTSFAFMQLINKATEKQGIYWWIAPIYKELSPVSQVYRVLLPPYLVRRKYEDKNILRYLELPNGSEIYFHSADRPDSLRGVGLDGLVMDEAAMMREQTWNEELRSALMDRKGWAIFISTPKGRNWFYHLYLRGQDPESWPDWQSWRQSTYINTVENGGYLDKNEIDEIGRELPKHSYRQEIQAEFIEGEGTVFRKVDEAVEGVLFTPLRGNFSLGADLGKTNDFTVLTAIHYTGRLCGFERFRQLDWVHQKKKIESFLEWYPGKMYVDATGIGDPIVDDLRNMKLNVEGYVLNSTSKSDLIINLSMGFDEGRWKIPDDPIVKPLINELKAFTYEITPSRHIRYGAPNGLHDDCVISFALAAWGHRDLKPPFRGTISYVFNPPRRKNEVIRTPGSLPWY